MAGGRGNDVVVDALERTVCNQWRRQAVNTLDGAGAVGAVEAGIVVRMTINQAFKAAEAAVGTAEYAETANAW